MSAAHIKAAPLVLGKRLKPFTLGHQALLESFDSGYAVGSEKAPSYEDFLLSVFICSLNHRFALVALSFGWLITAHNWIWSKRLGKFDVLSEMNAFERYLSEATDEPRYTVASDAEDSESGVPWLMFLKQKNQELIGLKDSEILDLTYQQALDNWLSHLAGKGVIRLWNDDDYAMEAWAKGL